MNCRLISFVASLLACALLLGLVCPRGVAGETPTIGWIRQFGTSGDEQAAGVSAHDGAIYLGVKTWEGNSIVCKYDGDGNELWAREPSATGLFRHPTVYGISACSSGIYAACTGLYPGSGDCCVGVVYKYDSAGNEVWARTVVVLGITHADAVSADSSGIYVAGITADFPPAGVDAYVRKYDASGNEAWTRQVSSGYDVEILGISVASGGVYVVGSVSGALTGQTSQGSMDAFVCKYDTDGNLLWTRQFGTASNDYARGVSASFSGIYVVGGTEYSYESDEEGFVRKYDTNGNLVWYRLPGFAARTIVRAVSTDSTGVYVAGEAHEPGAAQGDGFIRKYDHSGDQVWTYQFGSSSDDVAYGISADSDGITAVGSTEGTLPGQTYQGGEDAFVLRMAFNNHPSQPSNLSPSNGATNVSLTLTLQSSAFSDPNAGDTHAASQWQVSTTTGDYSSPAYDSGTTATHLTSLSVPAGELDYSVTYHWRVRHQDSHDAWSNWSSETSFTTFGPPNQPPSQASNVSPSNGATGVATTPILQSSAFSDPDGGDTHAASQWQVRIIGGDYSSPEYDSGPTGTHLTSMPIPLGELDYSTTCYWRVRHQDDGAAWSDWSTETWFVTVAPPNQPPNQPGNLSPADSAIAVDVLATLQSSAFSDPDAGDFHAVTQWQITATPGDYSSPAFDSDADASNLTSIMVPSGVLSYLTTYHWRVMYQDNHGAWSGWSAETHFTTSATPNQRPSQPAKTAPVAGATGVGLMPALSSSAFSDPDSGDNHAASQWQISSTAGDYSSPAFDSGTDSANLISITIPSGVLAPSATYHWRVRHQDDHGTWSEYSTETAFTTIAVVSQPPAQPSASSPPAGTTDVSLTPTLSSSVFSDPDSGDTHGVSHWQVRTTEGTYSSPVYDSGSSASHLTSITIPSGVLDYATTYSWHVRHMDNNGAWSDWSEEARFTTLPEEGDGDNGEVGGCCSSNSAKASASDIAIAWGTLGLCCGTGLFFARRLGKRNKE